MPKTIAQAVLATEVDRDRRLVNVANEWKRGLLTPEDYTERTTMIVLEWLNARYPDNEVS